MSQENNGPSVPSSKKLGWEGGLEQIKQNLSLTEEPTVPTESETVLTAETAPTGEKVFTFRKKEWETMSLAEESRVLRERADALRAKRTADGRLEGASFSDLRRIEDELEYIGPELMRRKSVERKQGKESKPAGTRTSADVASGQTKETREKVTVLVDALFPEDGKKTSLNEAGIVRATRLASLRSTIDNLRKDIRQKESLRKSASDTPDLEKTLRRLGSEFRAAKKERDGIVESLRKDREKAMENVSAVDAEVEALTSVPEYESNIGYRKKIRERLLLQNTIEEMGDLIGESQSKKESASEDPAHYPVEDGSPFLESELKAEKAGPALSELQKQEKIIADLKEERRFVVETFDEVLSSESDDLKGKLEKIKSVLTGVKSVEGIVEKIEAEKSAVPESLHEIDARIREAEQKRDKLIQSSPVKESSVVVPEPVAPEVTSVEASVVAAPVVEATEPVTEVIEPVIEEQKSPEVALEAPVPTQKPEVIATEPVQTVDSEPEVKEDEIVTPETKAEETVVPVPALVEETKPAEETPVEEKKPEAEKPKEEEKPVEEEKSVSIASSVLEGFKGLGIDEAGLRTIAGFADLSEGQQLFISESLRQVAARKIEEKAQEKASAGMSILKNFRLAKARKAVTDEVLHGGMAGYHEELAQLTEGMSVSGLDVVVQDGKLDIRFLSPVSGLENDESAMSGWASYNEAANRFSQIPYEWSLEGASKDEQSRYSTAKKSYDEAQSKVMGYIDRERTDPKEYATLREEYVALRVADNRVKMIQQMQAHPEVETYLSDLKNQNLLVSFFKTTASERGGYFVAGAAGRLALAGVLGWVAAPVAATVMGGYTARRRAKDTLVDQDRKSRHGVEEPSSEANTETKHSGTARAFVLASIPEEKSGTAGKKGLVEKLDFLSGKIADISDVDAEERGKELKSLHARITYTKHKLDAGLVNFGKGSEAIRNQVGLSEALIRAEMIFGLYDGKNEELEKRLDGLLGSREAVVDLARRGYVRKEMIKGAAISGVVSLVGAATAHAASEWFSHNPGPGVAETAQKAVAPSGTGAAKEAVAEAVAGKGTKAVETVQKAVTPNGPGVAKEAIVEAATGKAEKAVETVGKIYTETANRGDGATHLARRALSEYIVENKESAGLSAEQKVYVEDYLQRKAEKIGTLHVGSKMNFSQDAIEEAIGKAKGLSAGQIQNLHQYAEKVSEFRTGSPSDVEHLGTPSGKGVEAIIPGTKGTPGASVVEEVLNQAPTPEPVTVDMNSTLPWDVDAARWTASGEGSYELGLVGNNPTETLHGMVKAPDVVGFLAEDARRIIPFQETMKTISTDLFPSGAGGMDKQLFLEMGGRSSKDVFKECFRSVSDPSNQAGFGMDGNGSGRLGKFLLAAHDRYGISPKSDGSESFREYLERVSSAMVGKLDRASALRDVNVSDERLHAFAGAIAARP